MCAAKSLRLSASRIEFVATEAQLTSLWDAAAAAGAEVRRLGRPRRSLEDAVVDVMDEARNG